jgi:hypothetical protein
MRAEIPLSLMRVVLFGIRQKEGTTANILVTAE